MPQQSWIALAGPELIDAATAAMLIDPAFLDDAARDLNLALKKHMKVDFKIPLRIVFAANEVYVADVPETERYVVSSDELTDDQIDAVSGGVMTDTPGKGR